MPPCILGVMNTNLVQKAKEYALEKHSGCNQQYDGKPYEFHLEMVHSFGEKYAHLIPEEMRENVLAACWTHDIIEDCRENYNDVKNMLGEAVAELVYAVTNEKGKTRHERANDKYYEGLRNIPYANFLKICDRLANVKYSRDGGNDKKLGIYKDEFASFRSKLGTPAEYDVMWEEMLQYLNLHNSI